MLLGLLAAVAVALVAYFVYRHLPKEKMMINHGIESSISLDELAARRAATIDIPQFDGIKPWVDGPQAYKDLYARSLYPQFWAELARTELQWLQPFTEILTGDFSRGTARWFADGRLNVSQNCLDRHNPSKTAILWESDEQGVGRSVSYGELLAEVCRLGNWMTKDLGLSVGDAVTIYMPMVPEAVVAMLACARAGLIHNVVFAGFSAESLRDRLIDSRSLLLIAANEGLRGGKTLPLGAIAKQAMAGLQIPTLWFRRTSTPFEITDAWWWNEVIPQQSAVFDPVPMAGDAPLFMLYTSGSTGKPKGLVHSTAGYLLYALITSRWTFDLHDGDRFGCLADIGWITGHSYIVYGPLGNGVATTLFEGTPFHPNMSRYWELVDRLQLTQLYTAPTVLRALKKAGDAPVRPHSLHSLRILGSVGEPINPEAWLWYHDIVGKGRCAVVDTYWQTETGGHLITPLPGAMKTKAGSATKPFPGVQLAIIDSHTGAPAAAGVLVVSAPWPGMAM